MNAIDNTEALRWLAYYENNDFGEREAWKRTAQLSHLIYTMAPNNSKRKRKRRKVKDFMPKKHKSASNPLDILKMLEGVVRQSGGQDLRSEAKKQATHEELANV